MADTTHPGRGGRCKERSLARSPAVVCLSLPAMPTARQKKMKAVNDLHKYHRAPRVAGDNRAPHAEDLVPEDLPAVFAGVAARLEPNKGALSKASQRRLKRAKKEQDSAKRSKDAPDEKDASDDDGEGPVPIPVPRAKKEKKATPAMLLVLPDLLSSRAVNLILDSPARALPLSRVVWTKRRRRS